MSSPVPFAWIAFAVTAVAAAWDWRTKRIPNWLTLSVLALAPIAHAAVELGIGRASAAGALPHPDPLNAAGLSLLGALVCAVMPTAMYIFGSRGVGGGDIKLVAAVGALLGPRFGLEAVFFSFLLASSFVVLRLAYQGTLLRTLGNGVVLLVNPLLPQARRVAIRYELTESVRLGPALCAGVALAIVLRGGIS